MRIFSFLMVLLTVVGVISCSENEPQVIPKVIPNFSNYDSTKLQQLFVADKFSSEFEFSSQSSWTAEVSYDTLAEPTAELWLTLSATSGESGANKIIISAEGNTTGTSRTASIILQSAKSDTPITITVEQKSSAEDIVIPEVIPNFSNYDSTKIQQLFFADKFSSEFEFSSKSSWTAEVTDVNSAESTAELWLMLSAKSGESGDNKILISAEVNTTGIDRKASVILQSAESDTPITITVEQKSTTEDGRIPEKIYPVDFRYLTFGPQGDYGAPSISYIKSDGTVVLNQFKDVNGENIGDTPNDILQSKDNLLVSIRSFYGSNKIEIINANSFKKIKTIDFGSKIAISNIVSLDDDRIFVAGSHKIGYNRVFSIGTVDTKSENSMESIFDVDYKPRAAIKVDEKIVVVSKFPNTEILFFDTNNITLDGMRILNAGKISFDNSKASLVVDKNKMIWTVMQDQNYEVTLCCIDPVTETIIHDIIVPGGSTIKTTAIAMSNDGQNVYVRTHEAFYKVNVDKATFQDDPIFEHTEHTGLVCDLKMTKEGTLLFIDQRYEANAMSRVYEYKENSDGSWVRLVADGVAVAPHTKLLYVAKY